MEYEAVITREGKHWLAEFPDCPGCQTFAESEEALHAAASEALSGWLESMLDDEETVPRPRERRKAPRGATLWSVPVHADVATALALRFARLDAGLTQAQLAARAKVSRQQIAKLERPGENPTVGTLAKLAQALGATLDVQLVRQG